MKFGLLKQLTKLRGVSTLQIFHIIESLALAHSRRCTSPTIASWPLSSSQLQAGVESRGSLPPPQTAATYPRANYSKHALPSGSGPVNIQWASDAKCWTLAGITIARAVGGVRVGDGNILTTHYQWDCAPMPASQRPEKP